MADARAIAENERAALLDQAAADAAATKSAAEDMIAKERAAAARQTIEQAGRLAVDIAAKLVAGLANKAANDAFLDDLCNRINALSPDLKVGLVSADGQGSTEVVTAEPLDQARAEQCRQRIAAALGGNVSLHFRTDPRLLAGVELNGPHAVVRASWRNDLDRILEELSHHADGR
jgi:F-type H+-transporting ATPase subunit b